MADNLNVFGDVAGAGIVTGGDSIEVIPATAGNVEYEYVVPAGSKKQIMFGHVKLTTNATVANRRMLMKLLDASDNLINDIHSGAVVAASQADVHHEFMQGVYRETAFIANTLQVPIPLDWVALPGYKFVVSIENGVAGDSYSGALAFMSK